MWVGISEVLFHRTGGFLFLKEGQFDLCFRFVNEMERILFPSLLWLYGMALSWTSFLGKIWEECPGKSCFLLAGAVILCQLCCACSEPSKTFWVLKQDNHRHLAKQVQSKSVCLGINLCSLIHDETEILCKAYDRGWFLVDTQHGK